MKNTIQVTIKPNARKNELLEQSETNMKIAIKAPPEKGKANAELVKFLEKKTGKNVKIISGFTSRKKLVKLF